MQSLNPASPSKIVRDNLVENPGYHISKIEKGVLGNSSKILEEVMELIDSEEQGCKIMALVELSDLMGAISAYLDKHHPGTHLSDLMVMHAITRRAFKNGYRR